MEDYCIDAIALLVSWFENRNYNEHALVGLVQGHVEDDQNERFRKGMHAHMDLYRLACVSHDYRLRQYSWDKLEAAFRRFCYPTTFDLSCWKDALNQVTPLPAQTLLGVKDPLLDLWIRIGLENLQVCRPYLLRVYPRSPTLFMARFFEVGQHLLDREQGIVSWETPFAWWSFDNLAPHLDLTAFAAELDTVRVGTIVVQQLEAMELGAPEKEVDQ
ncbi:hypothetical protein KEM54_006032 [Ascosphaera aggregata]|nr:hypothetical protein KEM54_006032 [Ascosphaera aggregata]